MQISAAVLVGDYVLYLLKYLDVIHHLKNPDYCSSSDDEYAPFNMYYGYISIDNQQLQSNFCSKCGNYKFAESASGNKPIAIRAICKCQYSFYQKSHMLLYAPTLNLLGNPEISLATKSWVDKNAYIYRAYGLSNQFQSDFCLKCGDYVNCDFVKSRCICMSWYRLQHKRRFAKALIMLKNPRYLSKPLYNNIYIQKYYLNITYGVFTNKYYLLYCADTYEYQFQSYICLCCGGYMKSSIPWNWVSEFAKCACLYTKLD